MSSLILHEYARSGNCYKIRLTAAHLGIAIERREYDIMAGETRTAAFLTRVNANGRIPVLQIGDASCPKATPPASIWRTVASDPDRPVRSRRHAALDVLGAI